ncbi:hypothetical protein ACIRYZ_36520 [Kitasatospora sp. NPDC101155]|uniref:nSTAND1 domain-containing NTPase n=1 Tax=Kitasatospora sp. NPDC101155 TaxID=3364097 RepID=UPI0037FED884
MSEDEPQVHLQVNASDDARAYVAGRDLHMHLSDGVHGTRKVEPGGEPVTECPYPGMTAFDTEQARWFFGREREIADLLVRLDERRTTGRPLLVLGASGAGKSSLLRAGLLPALAEGRLPAPGSAEWPRVVFTPTAHPMAEARRRLAEPSDGGRTIVLVDQLEELFTLAQDDRERREFLDLLAGLAEAGALVGYGLRGDFYARAAEYPQLRAALEDRPIIVRPLTEQGLREAVLFPARSVGLEVEPGLVELLLQDLGGTADGEYEAGRLPLLAHALRATWQLRHGHTLTVQAYRDAGGIENSVATTADGVYLGLDEPGRRAARSMLLRLVRLGDDTDDTRRRIAREDLLRDIPHPDILDALIRGRLLAQRDETVEITHEALLRAWPRLRDWITEDRPGLLAHQRLAEATEAWLWDDRSRAGLLRGQRLASTRKWAEQPDHRPELTEEEQEFLAAGIRLARLRRFGLGAAALTAILGLVAGLIAVQQSRAAAHRAAQIASAQLADEAGKVRDVDPGMALRLSLAAFHTAPTKGARDQLYASAEAPYPVALDDPAATEHKPGAVVSLAFSADGKTLAGSDNSHQVRLWDVLDQHHPTYAGAFSTDGTAALAFAPSGRLLAVHGKDSLQLYDVADTHHPTLLSSTPDQTGVAYDLAFSPDGRTLATGADGGAAQLWNITDPAGPAPLATLQADFQDVTGVAFHPGGRLLAAASNGGTVRLWDLTGAHPSVLSTLPVKSAWTVAFHPAGNLLLTTGTYGEINYFDLTDPSHPGSAQPLDPSDGSDDYFSSAVSANGRTFATVGTGGSVKLFKFDQHPQPSSMLTPGPYVRPGSVATRAVAFQSDNQTVATGDDHGQLRIWTTPAARIPQSLDTFGPGSVFGLAGRILVTHDPDNGYQLWDIGDQRRPHLAASLPKAWTSVSFLDDDHTLLTLGDKQPVALWDASDPTKPVLDATVPSPGPADPTSVPLAVASTESNLLALSNGLDTIELWDISDRHRPQRISTVPRPGRFDGLGLQQHGRVLVAFDESTPVQLWSLTDSRHPDGPHALPDSRGAWGVASTSRHQMFVQEQGRNVLVYDVPDARNPVRKFTVTAAADSAAAVDDGRYLAIAAGDDNSLTFWDLSRPGRQVGRIAIQGKPLDIPVSDDGRLLGIAGTLTDKVQVWNVAAPGRVTADDAVTLPNQSDLAFGPDNGLIATDVSASAFGYGVRLWYADPNRMYQDLCAELGQLPPPPDWSKYTSHLTYSAPCG